jgi:hypothetical protein
MNFSIQCLLKLLQFFTFTTQPVSKALAERSNKATVGLKSMLMLQESDKIAAIFPNKNSTNDFL